MSCDGKSREVEWMVGDDGCHPCALCSHQKRASFVLGPHLPIHVRALVQLKQLAHEPSPSLQPRRQPELQRVEGLHWRFHQGLKSRPDGADTVGEDRLQLVMRFWHLESVALQGEGCLLGRKVGLDLGLKLVHSSH
jgi:hypothetical protein